MKRDFQILDSAVEGGIEVGNHHDKYNTKNPLAKLLQENFQKNILELIRLAQAATIHEAGCGESFWTLKLRKMGYAAKGGDFSSLAMDQARENGQHSGHFLRKVSMSFLLGMQGALDSPGPIQRFSSGAFVRLVKQYFSAVEVRMALPQISLLAQVEQPPQQILTP